MTSVRIISRLTSNFFVAHFTFTFDLSLKRKLQRGERSPEWTRATNLPVLCYRDFQAAGWALHPRDTRKHAVLCNLRGFLQIPQTTQGATIAAEIPPPCSLPPDDPEAILNAAPMQISIIVMRQICHGKGHSPHPRPLKHSRVTADDRCVGL